MPSGFRVLAALVVVALLAEPAAAARMAAGLVKAPKRIPVTAEA